MLCKLSFPAFFLPSNDSVQSTGFSRQCSDPQHCRLKPVLWTLSRERLWLTWTATMPAVSIRKTPN